MLLSPLLGSFAALWAGKINIRFWSVTLWVIRRTLHIDKINKNKIHSYKASFKKSLELSFGTV